MSNDLKKVGSVAEDWQEIGSKIKSVIDLHVIKAEIFKRNPDFFLKSFNPGIYIN